MSLNIPYRVGDSVKIERLGDCTIVAVHPAGTIDVETYMHNHYRVTGLPSRPDWRWLWPEHPDVDNGASMLLDDGRDPYDLDS